MKKWFAVGLVGIFSLSATRGALYSGNGSTGAGGPVGQGSLNLTDNGTTISATFNKGGSAGTGFNDVLVLFVDSVSGVFTDTTHFSDSTSTGLRRAVSGLINTDNRSTAIFAPGFTADYAIAVSVDFGAAVFHLVSGGPGSLELIRNIPFSPTDSKTRPTYNFSFDWADVGLDSSSAKNLRFESSYITQTGSRSLESFESLSGTAGFGGTVTFNNYDLYPLPLVPEPANAALAVFGGIVVGAGVLTGLRRRKQLGNH